MKKLIMLTAGLMVMSLATTSFAHEHDGHDMTEHQTKKHAQHMQTPHEHGEMKHGDMQMDNMPKMFLVKKEVDGYAVTFHVMPAKEGMKHGGSHNVMIKVEKDGVALHDVVINSKVFLPNKTTDSKMLMKMGDWYMAGYDLDAAGKNGIMILFKTSDGEKHKASVYYMEGK